MNKIEIENKICDLRKMIESCKDVIKANEKAIKNLEKEKEKPTFERVERGKKYYTVTAVSYNGIFVKEYIEEYMRFDKSNFENNDYFLTKERAEEVADKINFLLKLERLHDTFCPDYKPDWDNNWTGKFYILFDNKFGMYISTDAYSVDNHTTVYFNSRETIEKVCKELNKEMEKKQ